MRTIEARTLTLGAVVFFVVTVCLGLLMRVDMATGVLTRAGWSLANLRHAHSHAGYYGVLTLAWWTVERQSGRAVSRQLVLLYAASALLAVVGFAWFGYRSVTIVLSTVVAAGWLWVGMARLRARRGREWLDAAPYGLVLSVLLVPAVAVTAKHDPSLSRDLAHVFVGVVSFTMMVPAAWQHLGMARTLPLTAYVPVAVAAAFAVVFATQASTAALVATVAYAVLVSATVMRASLDWPAQSLWLVHAGSMAFAAAPFLPGAPARIAGLHFLILGPLLASFFAPLVSPLIRRLYAVALGFMLMSIVVPEHLAPESPARVTAAASTLFVAVALVAAAQVAAARLFRQPPRR